MRFLTSFGMTWRMAIVKGKETAASPPFPSPSPSPEAPVIPNAVRNLVPLARAGRGIVIGSEAKQSSRVCMCLQRCMLLDCFRLRLRNDEAGVRHSPFAPFMLSRFRIIPNAVRNLAPQCGTPHRRGKGKFHNVECII